VGVSVCILVCWQDPYPDQLSGGSRGDSPWGLGDAVSRGIDFRHRTLLLTGNGWLLVWLKNIAIGIKKLE